MVSLMADTDGLIGESLMTGVTLLVVVFAALAVLAGLISLFGQYGKKEKAKPKAVLETPPAPSVLSEQPDPDAEEIAAVIAAAVAMMAPAGTTYRVKKITPANAVQAGHPAWATAAIRQNTSPF